MKKILIYAFLLFFAVLPLTGCNEDCQPGEDCYEEEDDEDEEEPECEPAPSDCNETFPTMGALSIELSGDGSVVYTVFRGPDVETGEELVSSSGTGTVSIAPSISNGQYCARALYTLDYKGETYTIETIDGGELNPSSESYCYDTVCYEAGKLKLNLTFDEQGFKDFLDNKEAKCFIASAVYGPRSEPVRYLRSFRDSVLLKYAPGKLLVRLYYAYSLNVAAFIRKHPAAVTPVRVTLDGFIFVLRNPFLLLFSVMLYGVFAAGAVHLVRRKS